MPVITAENLSKKFVIAHESRERYTSLRDVLAQGAKKLFSFPKRIWSGTSSKVSKEEFWALKDLHFEINQGDRVGIIGRNGAGKSTLLKILSRITPPTEGKVTIKGRVASLLEVGTGFHPELTGRENIFLNGAILGMSRAEIRKKFDEIVAFAEVEKFLDTPVKRYSSGMYVRLAFSVAAHLEPEILIVDEVLAVGDAQFQKKCLGKMEDVSNKEGRTVLFVSHNMGTVMQLCTKGILLIEGRLDKQGHIDQVVDSYIKIGNPVQKLERKLLDMDKIQFSKIFMSNASLNIVAEFKFDEEIYICVDLYFPKFSEDFELAMRLIDKHKKAVFTIHEKLFRHFNGESDIKLKVKIPAKFLTPGSYSWIMCINQPGVSLYDLQNDVASFLIQETGSDFARYFGEDYGVVFAPYEISKIEN